jgi:hypothetical protein
LLSAWKATMKIPDFYAKCEGMHFGDSSGRNKCENRLGEWGGSGRSRETVRRALLRSR